MKYDLSNKPVIVESGKEYIVTIQDLYDDIGDSVHAKSPFTGERWRFYYKKIMRRKVLDRDGVIQL